MAGDQTHSVKGDRALASGDEDKLGFREVAKRVATSLVDRASEDGLVIGIEGTWGSGKSSLLFLIRDELGKLPEDLKPTVINFRPWLIGNRDALITSLFGEFSRQLDQVALNAGDATRVSVAKAKEAGEAVRSFMNGLSRLGTAIEFVGEASGIGLITMVGKGAKAAGGAAGQKPVPRPLSELKDKLVSSLRDLGHRFVVTIDDVDRLEPSEVIEVLRLVRSVVDLPNVIYLLCYDSQILARSIEKAAGVDNGKSYLEKIVQLTVMVPKPEPLQLRQWFSDQLHLIGSAKDEDELARLEIVIDYEGGRQLRTPRSVVRALDAVRFFWPPLRELKADIADLVWLQLIKDGNPALYRWIEEYCATAAAVSLGTARVEEGERTRELAALLAAVDDSHYFDDVTYRYNFAEHLPGVETDYGGGGNTFKIFQAVSDGDRDKAIQKRRLASPDHYRLYFALAGPSHALTQADFTSMWEAAQAGADQTGTVLLRLHDEHTAGSLTKADLMLERIKGGAHQVLAPEQCENVVIAFSQVMDEAYRRHPFDQFWVNSLWDRAQRLIPLLLSPLAPRRAAVVTAMFSEGAAIGWLTSLFRHETFAHGRFGDRVRPSDDWLFTDGELDLITDLMLGRYRLMSARDVLGCPSPISLLFAWRQGGDEQGPRRLVEGNIVSDDGLIETLEHLTSTRVSSNRGKYYVLTKDNLAPFMDHEEALQRLRALKSHNALGERASRLLEAFTDASDG